MLCVELCVLDGPDEIIVVVRIIELADEISSVEEIDDEVVKIVFVPDWMNLSLKKSTKLH